MNFEHNWFYVPPVHISKAYIVFPKEIAHHANVVLRKKERAPIVVTDGQGNVYTARIIKVRKNEAKAEILEKEVRLPPDPPYIDLAFVPLKGNRTEFIIEKGKELGVRNFLPFISQHAVVKYMGTQKQDRFFHIMISAMLQSQQSFSSTITLIKNPRALSECFNRYDKVYVADIQGTDHITAKGETVLFVIGPEGGFDHEEISCFVSANAQLISLGAKRLRSETAAIVGLVKVLATYQKI